MIVKKVTKNDVDMSADIAKKVMQAAIFSLKRAKILKP